MLQKHIQKPITYISLFLLRLIRRAQTQAWIPHTAVLLLRLTALFWLLEQQIRCSGNYCCTSLLQGVLLFETPRSTAVLTGGTLLPMLWLCAIFTPHAHTGAWRLPVERLVPCECHCPGWQHTRSASTPGKRVVLPVVSVVQLAPPQTNWVGVPVCGCLALQALSTLGQVIPLANLTPAISRTVGIAKAELSVVSMRIQAEVQPKIAAPWSSSGFCKFHYITTLLLAFKLRLPLKLDQAYNKFLLHHKQAPFKFIVKMCLHCVLPSPPPLLKLSR